MGGERRVVETDDLDDDEDLEDEEGDSYETRKLKIMKRKEKIQKLLKKQEMDKLLHKAEKKAKKKEKERLKSQVTAVNKVTRKVKERLSPHQDLPSASDYSDLEVDGSIDVISKTDRQGTLQSDLTLVRQEQSSEYINTSFSVRAMRAFKTRQ